MKAILVMGIGNTLLSDEGIGLHVLEAVRASLPDTSGVTFLDGGTLSFVLAADIAAREAAAFWERPKTSAQTRPKRPNRRVRGELAKN